MNQKRLSSKEILNKAFTKENLFKPPVLSLIISNLLIAVYAIVDNLSVMDVLWVYWIQSVIIGVFNFFKMMSLKEFSTEGFKQNDKEMLPTRATKISTSIFFLIHYGIFHVVYAVFLTGFSYMSYTDSKGLDWIYLVVSSAMFVVSYIFEFIKEKEKESSNSELPNIGTIMFAPYVRIIPMHLIIIFGGFAGMIGTVFSVRGDLALLAMFIILKAGVDVISHSISIDDLKTGAGVSA
ncbi:MAG: hypothetical protein IPM56_18355 [Ignavibacteriales bacterium]|nr:MAG: hypothetical protein IPM56_18355 [Ignavibacteriales bacterium]